MRVSTNQLFQSGIQQIQQAQEKVARTQLQLSSGQRLLNSSDDPSGAVQALQLRSTLDQLDRFDRSGQYLDQRLRSTESIMASVVDGLQRVRELAIQGNTGSQSTETRRFIAAEIRQSLEELVQLANSQDATGEYIFAGVRSQSAPFVEAIDGVVTYEGDAATRSLRISASREISVGVPGDRIFFFQAPDGAGGQETTDLFATYRNLAEALELATDSGDSAQQLNQAVELALGRLDSGLDQIMAQRGAIGTRLSAVEGQARVNDEQRLQVRQTLSAIEDLDFAEAISRFNVEQTVLQAAQQTYVQVRRLSLFDYLR